MGSARFLQAETDKLRPTTIYHNSTGSSSCDFCMAQGSYVCKDSISPFKSYCCQKGMMSQSGTDIDPRCDTRKATCSGAFAQQYQKLTCPYEATKCGPPSNNIELSRKKQIVKISIKSAFDANSFCWYRLSVESLHDYSQWHQSLLVKDMQNTQIAIVKQKAGGLESIPGSAVQVSLVDNQHVNTTVRPSGLSSYVIIRPSPTANRNFEASFVFRFYNETDLSKKD